MAWRPLLLLEALEMTDMQSTQNYVGIDSVGVGIDKSMGLC